MRLVLILVFAVLPGLAWPQALYPTKPVRLVVPYPAGSTPDIIGRTLAERLQASLGQPFVVENRSGAGGNIGAEAVAKAGDPHVLLVGGNGPVAINKHLYKALTYDPDRDLVPISLLASAPQMLVVRNELGVADFRAFVEHARRNPGRLSYASVGSGSASHLTMELLKQLAGIDLVHVPYPGSPQVNTAILNGQIAGGFVVPATAMPLVQGGRLKALGATTTTRSVVLPDMPTIAEQGFPGFRSTAWIAAVAPAKTPQPIVGRLSWELVKIIRADDVRQRMIAIYFQPVGTAPEALRLLMREEADRWGKVIKAAGVKPG